MIEMTRRGNPRFAPERACTHCGAMFAPAWKKREQKLCSLACQRRAALKHDDPEVQRERGSRSGESRRGTGTGYVKYHQRHQHRVVAEQMLGRPLEPGEIVHHKDNDKSNNDPSNLEVMTQADHIRIHHPEMLAARLAKKEMEA